MTGEPKTGDRLFELIKAVIQHMKNKYVVDVIGWCTDDGPDGKKARRLLLEAFSYLVVVACWAHQINLVVGDLLGVGDIAPVVRDSVEIVKWFNNHGVALELLKAEQKVSRPNSAPLALIRPVQTRWTSHFLSSLRLLLLSADLRACVFRNSARLVESVGREPEAIGKARWVISKIQDEQFWETLRRCAYHISFMTVTGLI